MKSVDVKRLRVDLMGVDKMPMYQGLISGDVPVYDKSGNELCRTIAVVRISGVAEGRYFHRVMLNCPTCQRQVSAGRLAQHFRVHQ
jgi:hypothetical protein